MSRSVIPAVVLCGLSTWLVLAAPLPATDVGSDDAVRRAIERSLPFLEREGRAWFDGELPIQDGAGCVSCHHVGFAVWSHHEAARGGISIPRERIDRLADEALEFLVQPRKPRIVSTSQMLLALQPSTSGGVRADEWRTLLDQLHEIQLDNGSWRARGQFPDQRRDEQETDATMTLWAMLAMRELATTTGDPRATLFWTQTSRTRAESWRRGAQSGKSIEWIAARSLLADDAADRERRRHDLLDAQLEDGGWPWTPGGPSNAFSTGQALYALARLEQGDSTIDVDSRAAINAGRAWLIAAQPPDGIWITPSRLISAKPSEARDVIYRYWGTAWATIGLSRSLQSSQRAEIDTQASIR